VQRDGNLYAMRILAETRHVSATLVLENERASYLTSAELRESLSDPADLQRQLKEFLNGRLARRDGAGAGLRDRLPVSKS